MSGIYDMFDGSITGEVLTFNQDAIPEPDTLCIRMTRGESRIAGELRKAFGGFKRVVIDVDGELHEFSADSLIRLLESYEGVTAELDYIEDKSRWFELFGTPERAARTLYESTFECRCCVIREQCGYGYNLDKCVMYDHDALLEWLRGDA